MSAPADGVGAALVDQSGRHLRVSGGDRVRFVNGMCMGNVAALPPGGWLRTAFLNPKGRLLAIADVIAAPDALLVVAEPDQVAVVHALLDRHAIADDVAFEIVDLAVHRVWSEPVSVWTAPPVLAPPPGPAASAAEVEVRRIEAGLPRYGIDVTEDNFPFETPLERLIDYKKGCYIGQEPIARVAARGSASKLLRGLRLEGDGAATVGAAIDVPDGGRPGVVTSAAVSPRFGAIALGYLPRGHGDPGAAVAIGGRAAVVVAPPFA